MPSKVDMNEIPETIFPVGAKSLDDLPMPVRWMTREEMLEIYPMSDAALQSGAKGEE